MTKTIAREYAGRGITANCVAPGFIDTGRQARRCAAQQAQRPFHVAIPLLRVMVLPMLGSSGGRAIGCPANSREAVLLGSLGGRKRLMRTAGGHAKHT